MPITRRTFGALTASAALGWGQAKPVPIGLELFTVRDELAKDDIATVQRVAKMGYQVVEFYAPYFDWSMEHARQMRRVLDDAGVRCLSTHNNLSNFDDANLAKTIELNQVLGSRYPIAATAGVVTSVDGWKRFSEHMTKVMERLRPAGMAAGFHNHQEEWAMLEDQRPMDVIAANTPRDFVLQFDVGTCVAMGADPIAWIQAHPGRIKSAHLKDWTKRLEPRLGYTVLFGEGDVPWRAIFNALEAGGVEYYLMEQEGSRFGEFETAERCLANYREMRG
jgi:sugar phosphate isomerase/epimerase